MVWFKACPRCKTGDVSLENDIYGWHAMCMACGYVKNLESPRHVDALLKPRRPEIMPVARSA